MVAARCQLVQSGPELVEVCYERVACIGSKRVRSAPVQANEVFKRRPPQVAGVSARNTSGDFDVAAICSAVVMLWDNHCVGEHVQHRLCVGL
jgi:hypothetical protein